MLMSGAQLHALIGEGEQDKNFWKLQKCQGILSYLLLENFLYEEIELDILKFHFRML